MKGTPASWILLIVLSLILGLAGCSGSSGDDDDDDAAEGTTLSGTIQYEGAAVGETVIIGAFPQWPPTAPPIWMENVAVPEAGFPFDYQVSCGVTGPYYVAAYLDVDPNDGVAMNLELDPMHIPTVITDILDGQNTVVDFVLIDDAWGDDDDDDDDDDDSGDGTKVAGFVFYTGPATGETVVISFYDYWPPMGPPKHHFDLPVPDTKDIYFDYEIEVDFTGSDWRIIAHLDVNPDDGGYNSGLDPADLSNDKYNILEGQTTTRDFVLMDP